MVEAEMSEQSLFRRSAPYKPYSGSQKNDITLSGVFFLSIAGVRLRRVVGDAIADLRFSEEAEADMSEQSLFRRSAPYKPYSWSEKKRLNVKCWGADYKISQYNIFGYQNLSVSRSIKVCVYENLRSLCVLSNLV